MAVALPLFKLCKHCGAPISGSSKGGVCGRCASAGVGWGHDSYSEPPVRQAVWWWGLFWEGAPYRYGWGLEAYLWLLNEAKAGPLLPQVREPEVRHLAREAERAFPRPPRGLMGVGELGARLALLALYGREGEEVPSPYRDHFLRMGAARYRAGRVLAAPVPDPALRLLRTRLGDVLAEPAGGRPGPLL